MGPRCAQAMSAHRKDRVRSHPGLRRPRSGCGVVTGEAQAVQGQFLPHVLGEPRHLHCPARPRHLKVRSKLADRCLSDVAQRFDLSHERGPQVLVAHGPVRVPPALRSARSQWAHLPARRRAPELALRRCRLGGRRCHGRPTPCTKCRFGASAPDRNRERLPLGRDLFDDRIRHGLSPGPTGASGRGSKKGTYCCDLLGQQRTSGVQIQVIEADGQSNMEEPVLSRAVATPFGREHKIFGTLTTSKPA